MHRDGEPADQAETGPRPLHHHRPRGDKRLFLWDEGTKTKTPVTGRAYWFNDHDYHGSTPIRSSGTPFAWTE